ncbi:MAG: 4-hydroxybenzoate 3-monooxygenase [Granulosicoccaceae bacterium]
MRVQVAIIGGGPSGLLLGQLLHKSGIDTIVLERKTREYVLSRIRAGVLERGFVELMEEAGAADRLHAESFTHNGVVFSSNNGHFDLSFDKYINRPMTVYGQTELTRDLYDAREHVGAETLFNVVGVTLNDLKTKSPSIDCVVDGESIHIDCDYIAGCDGFHGVCRQHIPKDKRKEYIKEYPFGWLGILSETAPVHEELVYSNSDRGFALCSMRNQHLSRYYIQCDINDSVDNWSDAAFWDELKRRIPEQFADQIETGPSTEKSIAPLRSFVCEPMQWGNLFLCGDAAHIVPPTGAKGLNTAASDVRYLYRALKQHYANKDSSGLESYSQTALDRVWKVERFSWWMTSILHRFPDQSGFDIKIQQAEIAFLQQNEAAQASLAINYVGLPY